MEFEKAAEIFDRYIDWEKRLSKEMPFILARLKHCPGRRVADAACGSGFHAVALAEAGFDVTAIDPLQALLDRAKQRACEKNVSIVLGCHTFDSFPENLVGSFDGLICMGNSISLVPQGRALKAALAGLAGLLKQGGKLLLHTINYPMLHQRREDPWGPVRVLSDGSLLLKGFLPRRTDLWDALFIHLKPGEKGGWTRHPVRFSLYSHCRETLTAAAGGAGLNLDGLFGGFSGEEPDRLDSSDLIYEWTKGRAG